MIRRAHPAESELLSQLALRSKAHWPYPKEYLNNCVTALKIDPDYVQQWPVFVEELNEVIVGFFALKEVNGEKRLDHLWIEPTFIREGLGTRLFSRAIQEAQNIGWTSFRLAADPYALEFYRKVGCIQIGNVQSRIKPDLVLPHLEFQF